MIVSLLYKVTWKLLAVPSVLLRSELAKDAELLVLRHENAVLRRQLAAPVRYEPADRFWFVALSRPVGRHRWRAVFAVTPGILLAWHPQVRGLEVGPHRPSTYRTSANANRGQGTRTAARQGNPR